MKKPICKYLGALLCVQGVFVFYLYGQKVEPFELKLVQSVYLDRKDPMHSGVYLHFPNLQKRTSIHKNGLHEYKPFYYYNAKELKKIKEYEEVKDYANLEKALFHYVQKFGIRNFKKDVDLVWKLAQLYEMQEDTAKALYFYNLALKNHSKYYDPVKVHFERLKEKTKSEYVDLETYYKIVEARARIDTLIPPKGVLLKMGDNINSIYPDYAPFMHPNNKLLIFTSKRSPWASVVNMDYEQHEDIYFVMEDYLYGGWTNAEKFADVINSRYNEGSACVNYDGNLLIFSRCNSPDGYGICDLYSAELVNGKWTNVKNLGPNVNTSAWESHPNLSPDGNTLYFSSNRGDGFGRCDIWKSERLPNGEWGMAQNLGPVINTLEDEVSPYFHSINNTLYFSSTGHLHSFGGFDIFKARWLDNHFEEPKNLGPLVNTPKDEYYFAIDGKGEKIFYAHQQEKPANNFDIFSFPMPMGARPDAITTLAGYLIDSTTQKPLKGIIVAIDLEKGVEIEPKILNPFGYFEFELINQRKYQLLVIGDDLLRIKESNPLSADSNFAYIAYAVQNKKPIAFDGLEFEKNKANITDDIAYRLDYIVEFLKKYPFCKLHIEGHTDAEGDAEYNLKLSQLRAENIKEYILEHLELENDSLQTIITTSAYGEAEPLYPNDTEEHKQKNRRVEFLITIDPKYTDQFLTPIIPTKQDTSQKVNIQIGIDKEYDYLPDDDIEEIDTAGSQQKPNNNIVPTQNPDKVNLQEEETDLEENEKETNDLHEVDIHEENDVNKPSEEMEEEIEEEESEEKEDTDNETDLEDKDEDDFRDTGDDDNLSEDMEEDSEMEDIEEEDSLDEDE